MDIITIINDDTDSIRHDNGGRQTQTFRRPGNSHVHGRGKGGRGRGNNRGRRGSPLSTIVEEPINLPPTSYKRQTKTNPLKINETQAPNPPIASDEKAS